MDFLKTTLQKSLHFVRNILNPLLNFKEVSILCYHSISDDQSDTSVSKDQFEKHLVGLKSVGYAFVSLDEIFSWVSQNTSVSRKAVAITFDDGYADFKTVALPILKKYNIPATLFIVGDRERYRSTLKTNRTMLTDDEVIELGKHPLVEIGWHTCTHPNLAKLNEKETAKECTSPWPMHFFAYPGGNYSDSAIETVKKIGFSAAFSIKRDLASRNGNRWLLPRIVILRTDTERDVLRYVSMAQHWYQYIRYRILSL